MEEQIKEILNVIRQWYNGILDGDPNKIIDFWFHMHGGIIIKRENNNTDLSLVVSNDEWEVNRVHGWDNLIDWCDTLIYEYSGYETIGEHLIAVDIYNYLVDSGEVINIL